MYGYKWKQAEAKILNLLKEKSLKTSDTWKFKKEISNPLLS